MGKQQAPQVVPQSKGHSPQEGGSWQWVPQGAEQGQHTPPQVVYVEQKKNSGCAKAAGGGCGAFILIFVVLVVVGMVIGDDSEGGFSFGGNDDKTPVLGDAEYPGSIGNTITRDGLAITLHNAYVSDTAGILTSYEAGWSYIIIDVTIKNVSSEKKSFNYLYWSAKDIDNGYEYDNELMGGDPAKTLGSGELGAGDLVRGEVVIKVRTTSENIRIKYDTNAVFGGANMYWIVRQRQ